MAQTVKKRASSKKKTGKKKSGRKKKNQLTLSDIILKQEFRSSLIFATGIILLIVALFAGGDGSLWNKIHTFYFSLTGLCGYYIPLAVLFFGIVTVLNKQSGVQYAKAAELFLLFLIICGFIHVNREADISVSFVQAIKNVYEQINLHEKSAFENGGVFGALVGGFFFRISRSKILANILLSLLTIADIMFLFGISLLKLFTKIEKPARKVGEYTGETIEKTKSEYEKLKQGIAEERAARQQRRNNPDVDPARIVNDFYNSPDSDENRQEEIYAAAKEAASAEEINLFSDFSAINSHNDGNASHAASEALSLADVSDIKNIFSVDAGIPATEKKEAVPELSAQEKQALHESLESALNEPEKAEYKFPPLDCLKRPQIKSQKFNENELKLNGEKLISALNSFNVSASIIDVVPGPTVTRYELSPAPGVKISKFVGLSDDLALHLAAPAGLRIEAPIPNKAAIGIEIPNRNKTTVTFREIIDEDKFRNAKSKLFVALGKDISGECVYSDLAKMPHLLVAGTTGSGKSVCLNSMIVSLLYNASPDEVKLLLIDPKQVEFGVYNGLPHLLVPVVSDPRKASGALGWAVTEMLSRYKILNSNGVRDIGAYNSLCDERDDLVKMPQIVIFIDELADLMSVAPAEVEDSIQRLAQMARAAGMHLVVATQRPSADVITGIIKANIPSRIALTVKSQIDSRIIMDSAGAEKLMGNGDMLYYPVGIPKPVRVQGSFLSDSEIENVVTFIKSNGTANYDDSVQQEIERQAVVEKKKGSGDDSGSKGIDSGDELMMRAIELFVSTPEKASISALQRHLGLGFAKAGRLMDTLEQKGIVGPHEGSKPRKVLMTKAQWYEMNALNDSPVTESTGAAEESNGADAGEAVE